MCNPLTKETVDNDTVVDNNTATTDTATSESLSNKSKVRKHHGVLFGSMSVFISMLAAALTFPFLQAKRDDLGCDALCFGTMQSTRSGLTLIGAFLMGRLSDRYGRHSALATGLVSSLLSYILHYRCNSITGMWIALIPSSLLNQNFTVLKALFAEYNEESGGTESERASALGRLGMAVGVGFMVGPMIGAQLLASYNNAVICAFGLTLISCVFLVPPLVPIPVQKSLFSRPATTTIDNTSSLGGVMKLLSLPAARSKGAQLLMCIKLLMALAFAIFMTVWTVSVRQRFNFGPKDHAYFMGWVGLWYALSQGVLARMCIRRAGEDPTVVLLICVAWLGLGRVVAMSTLSITVVYIAMALVIVALGIVNTAISSACSHLADGSQVGGLFGLLETIESAGGLIGPTVGGLLHKISPHAGLTSVVVIYCIVFILLWLFYRSAIVLHTPSDYTPSGKEKPHDKIKIN